MQQPPGYPPQQQGYYGAGRTTNTLAIVSLVAGVASYLVIPVLGAIVAIITGHMARGQIRQTNEGGGGLALAGLILGYVHLVLVLLAIAVALIILAIAGSALVNQTHP